MNEREAIAQIIAHVYDGGRVSWIDGSADRIIAEHIEPLREEAIQVLSPFAALADKTESTYGIAFPARTVVSVDWRDVERARAFCAKLKERS